MSYINILITTEDFTEPVEKRKVFYCYLELKEELSVVDIILRGFILTLT